MGQSQIVVAGEGDQTPSIADNFDATAALGRRHVPAEGLRLQLNQSIGGEDVQTIHQVPNSVGRAPGERKHLA